MFLPTTKLEMEKLGWQELDVILVSGDTYIDSSYNGIVVIGKWLVKYGFKVGIIAQPDINSDLDIKRLGEPKLFWGVGAGCVDSMVANYTATKKKRHQDDFTPNGENIKRPDRASIAYTNLIRRFFKNSEVPIVLGGIEASLRRVTHYDFWSDSLRRPLLFDAKADIICYGMAEKSVLKLATALKDGDDFENIRGICYISKEKREKYLEIPSYETCVKSKDEFAKSFEIFYQNCDPITAKGICQQVGDRFLVQNPPAENFSEAELDEIYGMDFERKVHPYYEKDGKVVAIDTIKNSVTTHRGCYGECNFCAIAVHQGRTVVSRSENSIINEIEKIASDKNFNGIISDVGGPTANMYGIECEKKIKLGSCAEKRCMFEQSCVSLPQSHKRQIDLLKKLRNIPNIKKIFIASGIRYDMILEDKKFGEKYLNELVEHHVSGQMKIAPEHTEDKILSLMGKKGKEYLVEFKNKFYDINERLGKKQFLTYYLIAAHPGCDESDMKNLKRFASKELRINPEQVQIFTPTPSTYSSLMYYTEINPFTNKRIFVEKDVNKKQNQKNLVTESSSLNKARPKNITRRIFTDKNINKSENILPEKNIIIQEEKVLPEKKVFTDKNTHEKKILGKNSQNKKNYRDNNLAEKNIHEHKYSHEKNFRDKKVFTNKKFSEEKNFHEKKSFDKNTKHENFQDKKFPVKRVYQGKNTLPEKNFKSENTEEKNIKEKKVFTDKNSFRDKKNISKENISGKQKYQDKNIPAKFVSTKNPHEKYFKKK